MRSRGIGPCTRLALANANRSGAVADAHLRVADPMATKIYSTLRQNSTAMAQHGHEQMELSKLAAEEMKASKFCLVPAGAEPQLR